MDELYGQALKEFQYLLKEAKKADPSKSMTMALATTDAAGRPSVRTIVLEAVDQRGLIFFTHLHSRKGSHLASNPHAAACFFWPSLKQQVEVEGTVQQVTEQEADAYWKTRDRDSQLAAWASHQSEPLASRETLKRRLLEYRKQFDFERQVPRPAYWSGFRIVPERIEFWKAGWRHLHERVCYQKSENGWSVTLLNP